MEVSAWLPNDGVQIALVTIAGSMASTEQSRALTRGGFKDLTIGEGAVASKTALNLGNRVLYCFGIATQNMADEERENKIRIMR